MPSCPPQTLAVVLFPDLDPNQVVSELRSDLAAVVDGCTLSEGRRRSHRDTLALKVIEHVADPSEFCESLAALAVPNGVTVVSTINRSVRAYAATIVAAEYLLNWIPKGTHEWSKFLTAEELVMILQRASISVQEMAGFAYNPLSGDWSISDDTSVNFIAFGVYGLQLLEF